MTSYKCKGHKTEFCYKLVGYPPDFKSKKKGGNNSSSGTAGNVVNNNIGIAGEHEIHQANFMYGLNTNIPSTCENNYGGTDETKHNNQSVKNSEKCVKGLL